MIHTGENYTLHLGDSARVLASFPADSIDLTVTSPPYDNLRDYGKDFDANSFNWQTIISELYRVTRPGGVVVWVVGDATKNGSESLTSFRQSIFAVDNCGFLQHDTMIYATDKMPLTQNRYEPEFEYMFVWSKGGPKTFNPIKTPTTTNGRVMRYDYNAEGETATHNTTNQVKRRRDNVVTVVKAEKQRGNIWYFPSGNMKSSKDADSFAHPATFPEALARDHILSWSNEGDTVLDCFLGSGTTGKMAMILKRKFIGIELDADYMDIANTRIKNAAGEITLTRSEAKKGKQLLPMFD